MTMSITHHDEHLVDRAAMLAMRAMIALQPAADLGPDGRPAFDDLMEKTPAADGVEYEPAALGGVAGWWCRPAEAEAGAAILYLHGGAYVVGSAKAYRHFAGQIAARAGAPVFVADYALAPERPFPAAVEDAEAAYRALANTGASRLAIVGDSAGGGLALVVASSMTRAAHDGAVPEPVATAALSPWTDLALTGESVSDPRWPRPVAHRGCAAGRPTALSWPSSDPQRSACFTALWRPCGPAAHNAACRRRRNPAR